VTFAAIDYIFIALTALFTIRCFLKGFISEIFSMAGIVFGLLAALLFFKNGAEFLRNQLMPDVKIVPEILAFIGILVIVFLAAKLVEGLLKNIIKGIQLGSLDKLLGIGFGLAEGIIVVSLILFLLKVQPLFNPSAILSDSFFARIILPLITGKEPMQGV
jgi:membrane protein required for colicin V production